MLNKNKLSLLALVAVAGVVTAVGVTQIAISKPGQGQSNDCDHTNIPYHAACLPHHSDGSEEEEPGYHKGHIEYWCCCECHHAFAGQYGAGDLGDVTVPENRYKIDTVGFNWVDSEISPDGSTLREYLKDFDKIVFGKYEDYELEILAMKNKEGYLDFPCGKEDYFEDVYCYSVKNETESYAYVVSHFKFCIDPDTVFTEEEDGKFQGFNCKTLIFTDFDVSAYGFLNDFLNTCKNLEYLDIGCFDTSSEEARFYDRMFKGCENLTTILASDKFIVNEDSFSESMFEGCEKLTGQFNSTIETVMKEASEEEAISGVYARIDRQYKSSSSKCEEPAGYFTEKPTYEKFIFNQRTETTVKVKGNSENFACSGSVVIPDKVNDRYFLEYFEGKDYDVVEIADEGFQYCGDMTSITLPTSIKRIGESAFVGCYALENLYYLGTMASWNDGTFEKGSNWRGDALFNVIHCLDGDINLE